MFQTVTSATKEKKNTPPEQKMTRPGVVGNCVVTGDVRMDNPEPGVAL